MFTKLACPPGQRRPRAAAIVAALATIVLAQTATPAAAADRFWTCPPNYFTNPVCWSNPGPVLNTDNLLIRPNGPIPVEVSFPGTSAITYQAVRSLTLNGALNSAAPTLRVSSSTLEIGTFNVGVDYRAVVAQTGGAASGRTTAISALSSYNLSGGSLRAASILENAGLLLVSGSGRLLVAELYNNGFMQVTGANASAETRLTFNYGKIVLNNATHTARNGAYNEVGAEISGSNSSFSLLFYNDGLIHATAGTLALPGYEEALTNRGELRIANAATLSVPTGVENAAGGVINLNGVDTGRGPQAILSGGNSDAALRNDGALQGAGLVVMPVNHQGRLTARAGGTLTFSQGFTSAVGSVMVSDGALRFDGPASFHNGAFISGGGATSFNNTLSVGAAGAAGRMSVTASVLLGSTYFADILGTLPGVAYDQLVVGGRLTLAPGSVLKLGSGSFVAQAGQSFNLLDWGTLDGVFGRVDTSAMQLASGATLDLSRLYVDGTVAVVPEPATWAMALLGIAGLLARLRLGRLQEHGA